MFEEGIHQEIKNVTEIQVGYTSIWLLYLHDLFWLILICGHTSV